MSNLMNISNTVKNCTKLFFLFNFLVLFNVKILAAELILNQQNQKHSLPQLFFVFNENYFLSQILTKGPQEEGNDSRYLQIFRKKAKKINQQLYNNLTSEMSRSFNVVMTKQFENKYLNYFFKLKKIGEYKILKRQTLDYMLSCLVEWNKNVEKSTLFIKEYSGFNFDNKMKIYFTHPTTGEDTYLNSKVFVLGLRPKFSNYFTAHIWSIFIKSRMQSDSLASIVANQLLTENDLRYYLNNDSYLPLQGNVRLVELMNKNLNLWNDYKKSPTNLNYFARKIIF